MPSDWERVAGDPALLAAVRLRYTGSGDVLDQLWWIEHPGEPAPSGAPDPVAGLASARDALYRPGAGPADAARFERSSASALDRTAALTALGDVDALRTAATPLRPPPTRASRRPLLAGVVLAALLIGGAGGFAAGRFTRAPAPPALDVFDRAQRTDDRPPSSASVPDSVPRSSLRLLGASTSTGAAIYAARRQDGSVCLVAIVLAQGFIASCTSDAAFAAAGLTLTFEADVDPENDRGDSSPREITPTWSPDGTLRF